MKMFIVFAVGSLSVCALLAVGCTTAINSVDQPLVAQEPEPEIDSRFEFVESGKFPNGTALDKQEYHIFRDKITGVKYLYFYRTRYARIEGTDQFDHRTEARTGGPSFTKLEEPALDR